MAKKDLIFDRVAMEMTKIDAGGKAGRQLDITEARQGLSCAIRAMIQILTIEEIGRLFWEAAFGNGNGSCKK